MSDDATYVGAGMPCSNCGNPLTPSQPHKCGVKYSGSGPVIPMGPPENPYAPPPDWEPGHAPSVVGRIDGPLSAWRLEREGLAWLMAHVGKMKAAGWKVVASSPGRSWDVPSRPRVDKHPLQERLRWEVVA